MIDYEQDRVQSVTQTDAAKTLQTILQQRLQQLGSKQLMLRNVCNI